MVEDVEIDKFTHGRGNGRGRGPSGNNSSSSIMPSYGNFVPEAKLYNPDVFRNLSIHQKREIMNLKKSNGWIDAVTLPPGYTIDQNSGLAVVLNSIISAIHTANINQQVSTQNENPPLVIHLPPAPAGNNPPNPPTEQNNNVHDIAGSQFGRSGRQNANPSSASVSTVSINGQPYSGQIFDSLGRPLTFQGRVKTSTPPIYGSTVGRFYTYLYVAEIKNVKKK